MAHFARLKHYYIENVDELLETVGHLKPYLRVYDESNVLLFNSRSRGDAKLLSNFHASSVPLPWRGLHFSSVEAMIFYTYIVSPKYNFVKLFRRFKSVYRPDQTKRVARVGYPFFRTDGRVFAFGEYSYACRLRASSTRSARRVRTHCCAEGATNGSKPRFAAIKKQTTD